MHIVMCAQTVHDKKYLMDVAKSHCDVVDKVNMCCVERKSMLDQINKYRDALDIGTVGLGLYNAEIDHFWSDLKADVVLGIDHANSKQMILQTHHLWVA